MAEVIPYLQGRGVVFTVIPRNASAADVAAAAPEELVARTIVAISSLGPALLVIPAGRELDEDLMLEALGDAQAHLASDRELEIRFPDYEPGALPPLSMLLLAPMYVDPSVVERDEIVFAAGRSDIAVKMATRDLIGNDPVIVAPLTSESRIAAPS